MKTLKAAATHDDTRGSALLALFDATPFKKNYQPGCTIALDGDSADAVYLVVSGTVRCCTINAEGNRQIFRFATKGEFLGLSDMDTWHFTAEAVDHVILKSIPRASVEQALAVDLALRREIRTLLCAQLQCREQQLLSLVTTKAADRLLQFLHDLAQTRRAGGYGGDTVVLPMCRRDIADHLGMSVETVSRAFGHLKAAGRIDLLSAEKYRLAGATARQQAPRALP
jgi:CRP-like cAMP-binding protein